MSPIISGGEVISGGHVSFDSGGEAPLTWDGVPPDGVKQVTDLDLGDSTSGAGTLTVPGYGDVAMAFDILAAAIIIAVEALDPTGVLDISITGLGTTVSPWQITVDVPVQPVVFTMADGDLEFASTVAEDTAGVQAAYHDGQIVLGALVRDNATGDVYEMDGTKAQPTYTRIDTV
jgi:hypothetical protein